MDTPRDGADREPDAPRPGDPAALIEGRFRSIEDKVRWMLAGRERPDTPAAEPLLPEMSDRDISVYVATSIRDGPWLSILDADDPPGIWRAVVALDRSESHSPQRHSPYGDRIMHERRVTHLEDPAQTDPTLRAHGIDGLLPRPHYCGLMQTRFTDVKAMSDSYVKGLLDSRVATALNTPYADGTYPRDVIIPIAELIGSNGHNRCEGSQLDGDIKAQKRERRAWERDRRDWIAQHGALDGFSAEPPTATEVSSFEGGRVVFRFGPNANRDGYTITSHYPEPPTESTGK